MTRNVAIRSGVIYIVVSRDGSAEYGVTGDGIGFHWYDTKADAQEDWGKLPTVTVDREAFEESQGN